MEELIKTIILGIIQGLTEWLPISSTGHLKVAEHFLHFLGPEDSLLFDFTLHIGTLIVVLLFFRKDIKNILSALVRLDFKTEYGKLIPLILVGTVPGATIGVFLEGYVKYVFQSLLPIAVAFIFFGMLLYSAKARKEEIDNISYSAAVIIGIAEGIAVIPGISRSGATITVALLLRIKRERAFNFSFLLSIPAIIGAIGYTFYTESGKLASAGLGWTEIIAGVTAAMVVGYFALKLLWRILAKKRFYAFAFYCWLFGAVLVVLGLSGF